MRQTLLYILWIVSIAVGYGQTNPVKATIDSTSIRIGEQFEYKITIDETENVIIPKLQNLKGLEVIDSLKMDTLNNQLIQKYILTGFDSGAFYIPKQQLFIKNQAYYTDSLLVKVATVPIDTTKVKKYEIKGIKGEPYQFDDYARYVYWALAVLLIVIVTLYFALKRTDEDDSTTFVPKLAPFQEAMRNLQLLDEKLLWQNNKIKEYYSELTDIIRMYIERELHVPALEQTTNEVVRQLELLRDANNIETEKETIKKLSKLFQQADLVKFAKSKPLAHDIEADRNIAELLINNIKPALSEEATETDYSTPVTIVEKPPVKKTSPLQKIFLILGIIVVVGILSFGIVKLIEYTNANNTAVTHVK
ncbi:conserved membrane hypothetical protein [Tenacibaculum litopenaei]|uniref:hypothetical protein n=1 Tax=Tenacibaculum litopenaei TaxID=396016 RepID=UPI003892DA0A